MNIQVYTDGSATSLGNPGGYGWVIVIDQQKVSEGSGFMESATNNDAELEAAIQGLNGLAQYLNNANAFEAVLNRISNSEITVTLISDSQLILGWISGAYRFKQEHKRHTYNALMKYVNMFKTKTEWVRGHSGNIYNERCDYLANAARTQRVAENDLASKQEAGESCIGSKKTGVVCIWYENVLKVIDLETNIIEDYSREVHGPRGSFLEIKKEKFR